MKVLRLPLCSPAAGTGYPNLDASEMPCGMYVDFYPFRMAMWYVGFKEGMGCEMLMCRWRVERFMQVVFAVGATALFVPVIFHTATVSETDSLNKDAPGMRTSLTVRVQKRHLFLVTCSREGTLIARK